ncbi:MAG: hypothetical protein EYC70_09695 [Planctomycetota bacterium]|nr:MAG: hypothetical protein EYC70_09695 [Planctomycetota bacterium]
MNLHFIALLSPAASALALSPILASIAPAAQNPIVPLWRNPRLQLDWERRYEHGIMGHDSLAAVDTDAAGNVYVAGASLGLSASYTYEIVTLKYSPDGALLWERRYDSAGSGFDDRAVDIDVGPDGLIRVLGDGPGASGDNDIVLLCYDSSGLLQWARRWSNWWSDKAEQMAVAADSSTYVLGGSYYPGNVSDIVLLKYDAAGALSWARSFHGGHGTDVGVGLGIDSIGNILVGGYSIQAPGGVNFDWLALQYDAAGTLLWSRTLAGAATGMPDYPWGVHADRMDGIVLTGYLVNSAGLQDFTTARFDGSGSLDWTHGFGAASGAGKVAASDDAGRVYVAGGDRVAAYAAGGTLLWTALFGDASLLWADATSITLDARGRLLVAGSAWDPLRASQFFLEAFSGGGAVLARFSHGGPASDAPAGGGLRAGPSGSILLTGSSSNGHDNDGLTLKLHLGY